MNRYIHGDNGRPDYVRDDHPDWSRPTETPPLCPMSMAGGQLRTCVYDLCQWWTSTHNSACGECAVRKIAWAVQSR